MKLSAVVIVKNEEKNIIDCLDRLRFCDEIVVIDDYSDDRTPDLISEFKKSFENIKIYKRKLGDDFSAQRQFGVDNTINDWVLFVDADERISEDLASEIKENLRLSDLYGFLIKRIDFMWGKELRYGETKNIKLLRLFDKRKGKLKGKVHEIWETKEKVGSLINPIFHYPHPEISDFLKEINLYTTIRSEELYEKGVRANFFTIILYAKAKFVVNYFFKMGFMDGTAGFIHAVLMSFHSFLVRGKLWLLWQKK